MGKGIDVITLASAKRYVKETIQGGGAVAGKNVIISGIEPFEGGAKNHILLHA